MGQVIRSERESFYKDARPLRYIKGSHHAIQRGDERYRCNAVAHARARTPTRQDYIVGRVTAEKERKNPNNKNALHCCRRDAGSSVLSRLLSLKPTRMIRSRNDALPTESARAYLPRSKLINILSKLHFLCFLLFQNFDRRKKKRRRTTRCSSIPCAHLGVFIGRFACRFEALANDRVFIGARSPVMPPPPPPAFSY